MADKKEIKKLEAQKGKADKIKNPKLKAAIAEKLTAIKGGKAVSK